MNQIKIDGKIIKRPSMDAEETSESIIGEALPHEVVEEMNDIILSEEEVDEVVPTGLEIVSRGLQEIESHSTGSLLYFCQASFANVRSGPGTGFGITGSLTQGEIVAFQPGAGLDRSPATWNDGWGWIRFASSNNWVAGWAGTGFTNSSSGHLMAVHQRRFQGTIELSQVNFRTGPGTEYPTSQIGDFLSLPMDTRINVEYFVARNSLPWSFTIPSRDLTQVWLCFDSIVTPSANRLSGRGWVRADLVEGLPADLIQPSSPIMGAINPKPSTVVVTSPTLNRRTGATIHAQAIGQYRMGDVLSGNLSIRNITEDRIWMNTSSGSWVASENTASVERLTNRVFRVNVPQANIRNAPDVSGTAIIGTQPSNSRLRITHRRRVTGGMDWFRFDQVIGGVNTVGWIADVNGFIEGEVGSPGIMMPPNAEHPQPWIDSRPVSLRNPDYIPGHTTGAHRPFHTTRNLSEISQIVIHHTASPITLTRMDIEAGWRSLGWWNGGYHEMIHADGTVEVCYNPEIVTNGAYGQNRFSYHISLVGDFRIGGAQPPVPQMDALVRRTRHWQRRLGIPISRVVGHSERTPTICPGIHGNELRHRIDGNIQTRPPSTAGDLARILEILQGLPRQVANVMGFGSVPGIINFLPNLVNTVQKSPEFIIAPNIVARYSFQEVFETSHIDGFNIKDGKVEEFRVDEAVWNLVTRLVPGLSVNLLSGRLGEIVENGSAILTIEPDLPLPWITLKIAAEKTLPSGNKFKFEMKFQFRAILRLFDKDNLGLEHIEVPVEAVGQQFWEQSYGWATHHYNEGALTLLDLWILLGFITITIATLPQRVILLGLSVTIGAIHEAIMEEFGTRGLEAAFNINY